MTTMETETQESLDQRSTVDLLRDLSRKSMLLIRQEIELAKTEMTEKAKVYARN
ncbi:MAG: phage holin family protein, partial [Planctomycetes bacterium]|nr:phage holin family protein [Planctomycetota bacterium]